MLSTKISASKSAGAAAASYDLYLWGKNDYGEVGNSDSTNKVNPKQLFTESSDWSKLGGGSSHTLSIKTDGTLWAWGYGCYGVLGDGTTVNKSSPVQIGSLTTWNSINAMYSHAAAILEN